MYAPHFQKGGHTIMSDFTIENTNKETIKKETPTYLRLKDVYHFRKDYGCILTRYEAIKDFISDIIDQNLSADQAYDYIVNSDLTTIYQTSVTGTYIFMEILSLKIFMKCVKTLIFLRR